MSTTPLHYLYDPLCGWCYGAAPLVKAAREVLRVIPHGGGMMTGARRQPVTAQLRNFVKPHDAQIARLSGQPFGDSYLDGLLRDTQAVFDSEPPTAAMLAAEALAGRGLDMHAQLQIAHYVEGRRIAERSVLIGVAASLGLDADRFAAALESIVRVIEALSGDLADLAQAVFQRIAMHVKRSGLSREIAALPWVGSVSSTDIDADVQRRSKLNGW